MVAGRPKRTEEDESCHMCVECVEEGEECSGLSLRDNAPPKEIEWEEAKCRRLGSLELRVSVAFVPGETRRWLIHGESIKWL